MANQVYLQSPTCKNPKNNSSIFNSPRIFTCFAQKGLFETDSSVMSPTSILDSKPFSIFRRHRINPESEHKHCWENSDSKKVGLGLVHDLIDEESDSGLCKTESRMVQSGSHLKIRIPPMPNSAFYPIESPKLPPDFGIKTRNSKLASFCLSPSSVKKFTFGSRNSGLESRNSSGISTGYLSASETEFSDDYFCVISRRPDIDNIINENGYIASPSSHHSESYLGFCYRCRKKIEHGEDIFMYRGDKAFCSYECQYQEMLLEEEMGTLEYDDVYGTCS